MVDTIGGKSHGDYFETNWGQLTKRGVKASVRWSQRQTRRSPCTTCEVEIYLMSCRVFIVKFIVKLDPVGSSVRYEMMKLCTGSDRAL